MHQKDKYIKGNEVITWYTRCLCECICEWMHEWIELWKELKKRIAAVENKFFNCCANERKQRRKRINKMMNERLNGRTVQRGNSKDRWRKQITHTHAHSSLLLKKAYIYSIFICFILNEIKRKYVWTNLNSFVFLYKQKRMLSRHDIIYNLICTRAANKKMFAYFISKFQKFKIVDTILIQIIKFTMLTVNQMVLRGTSSARA